MDFDDILFHESATYDQSFNESEDVLQKRNESYLKLKKKIVATSSVLSRYRETKNECDDLKKTILNLNNQIEKLAKLYEESLRVQISLKQEAELFKTLYDKTLHTYNDAAEQDKAKSATIKQLKDLAHDLKSKLESKTIESALMKSQYKQDVEKLKRDMKTCKNLQQVKIRSITKKLKRIKNEKYLEKINNDDMYNSPASADTGKGSSICTSDDEKSLSRATTPRRDDPPSPLSGVHLVGDANRCYISVSTSPIPDVIPVANTQNTNNQIDGEYVTYILNKMTNLVNPMSPIPWCIPNSEDSIVGPTIAKSKLYETSSNKHSRKYSSIKKKKILSHENLSNIFREVAQREIKKLLSRIRKRRPSLKNIVVNSKVLNNESDSQVLAETCILRKIGNKLITTGKNTNIKKKNNILKRLKAHSVKSTTSKHIKQVVSLKPSQEIIATSRCDESRIEENEKKINEAKKILSQYKALNTATKEKTSIKWRAGSKIKNTSLPTINQSNADTETTKSEAINITNNELKQHLRVRDNKDKTSEPVSKIRKSSRIRNPTEKNEDSNIIASNIEQDNNDCMNHFDHGNSPTSDYNQTHCTHNVHFDYNNLENISIDNAANTESCAGKVYDTSLSVFKTLVSTCVQNMKKKHSIKHVIPEDLCERFEEFLTSKFTVHNVESFVCSLNTETEENIGRAIVEFLCSPKRYNDATFEHYPLLPMTRSHHAVLVVMNRMPLRPNVMELVMKGIEYKMFQLNKTPPLQSLRNMIPLYVALCRINKQKDRLKLFCLDALYCLSYSATPVVYLVIQCWPGIFPLSRFSSANDPLFLTMVHYLLSNFSEDVEYNSKCMQHLLCNKYGYKVGEYTDDDILDLLLNIIKGDKTRQMKGIISAFLLLGKRTGVEWCYNNIIVKSLLPMIDDAQLSSYTKSMAVRLVGALTRPFPDSKTLQCGILYKKLLKLFGISNDPLIDEAILSSILYFRKKDNEFVKVLMQWRPTYSISQEIQGILETIVYTKPKSFWLSTLKKHFN